MLKSNDKTRKILQRVSTTFKRTSISERAASTLWLCARVTWTPCVTVARGYWKTSGDIFKSAAPLTNKRKPFYRILKNFKISISWDSSSKLQIHTAFLYFITMVISVLLNKFPFRDIASTKPRSNLQQKRLLTFFKVLFCLSSC